METNFYGQNRRNRPTRSLGIPKWSRLSQFRFQNAHCRWSAYIV